MSILKGFAAAAGFTVFIGALGFAQQDDERVRLNDEANSDRSGIIAVRCNEVKPKDAHQGAIECGPFIY